MQPDELNPGHESPGNGLVSGADVDLARQARCGFPEVIYGEGKPSELIVNILSRQQAAGQRGLVTRVNAEQATAVVAAYPQTQYHAVARTLLVPVKGEVVPASLSSLHPTEHADVQVAVMTAGSCDAPVAWEAAETLRWMSVPVVMIQDVGVAGPHRLLKHVPLLQRMKVIVCVAGMEAALPSVVGGHVACPVIGVPTSVGFAALLSMLTCCASNVVTVNIDGGFRGGYVAGMIVRGNPLLSVPTNTSVGDIPRGGESGARESGARESGGRESGARESGGRHD